MIARYARPIARTKKAAPDTAVGCRIRAEADLLASVTMLTANRRLRLEISAASWLARAALLEVADAHTAAMQDRARSVRIEPGVGAADRL